jgi:hypothetical protein
MLENAPQFASSLNTTTQTQLCDAALRQLDDVNGDVRSGAVKFIGLLAHCVGDTYVVQLWCLLYLFCSYLSCGEVRTVVKFIGRAARALRRRHVRHASVTQCCVVHLYVT